MWTLWESAESLRFTVLHTFPGTLELNLWRVELQTFGFSLCAAGVETLFGSTFVQR